MNKKSKNEKIFVMCLVGCVCMILLGVTGCGGQSCETVSCIESEYNSDVKGISIPGCGGCLTSGVGCNSSCWAQSYACYGGCNIYHCESGCDTTYYGSKGCIGCGDYEKHNQLMYLNDGAGSGCVVTCGDAGCTIGDTIYGCGCYDVEY